jgi:hypothetical protein
MSVDNEMDPGDVPAHLSALTQVEEMIIARSHVHMLVHWYRGHQYHYSRRCVSFMQNNIKIVDLFPNLPSELDIVILRPSNHVMENDPRYRSQFRADFRVRRSHILTWLHVLHCRQVYPSKFRCLKRRIRIPSIGIATSFASAQARAQLPKCLSASAYQFA